MGTAAVTGLIGSGVSTVGNLLGGGKAAKSQNAASNAAGQQEQQAMQLIQQYIQQAAPVVQSLVSGLYSGSNPYVQQQNQSINQLGNFGNSAQNQQLSQYGNSSMDQQLANWNGLKPQEMNQLTTAVGNAGMSDIKTAESQGAYGANQNAVIQQQLDKNRLNAQGTAVGIGSAAAGQELGALQSANQAGLSGLVQGTSNALAGTQTAGTLGNSLLTNILGGIGSSLGLLSPAGTGTNTLASMAGTNASTAASYGNPYQAATNSLGGGLAQLGSGKTASTPNTGTNTTSGQPYASNPVTNQGTGASVTGSGGSLIDAAGSGGYSTPYYGTGVPA